MPDADIALKAKHVSLEEHISYQTVGFAETELTLGIRQDARCILTTMLEHGKAVIQQLVDVSTLLTNDAKNAAHAFASFALI